LNVMTGVRLAITFFILILLTVVTLGVMWNTAHQPARLRTAGLVVLGLSAMAGVFALARIWRKDPPRRGAAAAAGRVGSSH
jgi:hypothetical protein